MHASGLCICLCNLVHDHSDDGIFFCSLFRTDTPNELALLQQLSKECGAFDAVVSNHWAHGGAGAVDLAKAVERACYQPSDFKFLYELDVSQAATQVCSSRGSGSGDGSGSNTLSKGCVMSKKQQQKKVIVEAIALATVMSRPFYASVTK